jgi:hypothetical protein
MSINDIDLARVPLSSSIYFICLYHEQDVLEKFEFFPIKCRIQRANEIYQGVLKNKREEQDKLTEPLKIKVFF